MCVTRIFESRSFTFSTNVPQTRDRQVVLAVGAPMVINDLDCDIEDLTMDDFPDESIETAQYVIAQASLSRICGLAFALIIAIEVIANLIKQRQVYSTVIYHQYDFR